jgi:hypothetical protein
VRKPAFSDVFQRMTVRTTMEWALWRALPIHIANPMKRIALSTIDLINSAYRCHLFE